MGPYFYTEGLHGEVVKTAQAMSTKEPEMAEFKVQAKIETQENEWFTFEVLILFLSGNGS